MPQQNPVTALKQADKPLSNVSSFTNLYNSHSNTGSSTSLPLSNSAVFTNNIGLVQKGTTISHSDHLKAKLTHLSQQQSGAANSTPERARSPADPRLEDHSSHVFQHLNHHVHEDESDDDSAFELNWQPQVSTENQYSLS